MFYKYEYSNIFSSILHDDHQSEKFEKLDLKRTYQNIL